MSSLVRTVPALKSAVIQNLVTENKVNARGGRGRGARRGRPPVSTARRRIVTPAVGAAPMPVVSGGSKARSILAAAFNQSVAPCAKQRMLDHFNQSAGGSKVAVEASPASTSSSVADWRCECDGAGMAAVRAFVRELRVSLPPLSPVSPLEHLVHCYRNFWAFLDRNFCPVCWV